MVPQPRRQNPQHQALTTTLRNICRDYPAGGGILRELLQNADDAGASEMMFVLDTRSHTVSNLLDPGLDKYPGPALLAYNNAKFSAEDFESLTSLGASKKIQDIFATGKFGRGFSSVSSRSIVSKVMTLLFLDPHHSWSATWYPPGGPEWDFTAHAQDDAMKNQLSAYSSLFSDFNRPLEGTIVRIPLRTALQAQESAICDEETTISAVQSSMEGFGREIYQGGLLFLRNVIKVSLSVDMEQLTSTEVVNTSELTEERGRACVRKALCALQDKNTALSEHIAFDIHFKQRHGDLSRSPSFSVHHFIEPHLPDQSLVEWAAMNKLHPWGTAEVELSGDIFTVLRLHIPTKQPVHIHGIFSISPDRGKLHGSGDASVQDPRPKQWNMTLLEHLVPQAWANLLERVAEQHPGHNTFHLWPWEPPERREMWDFLCSPLISRASDADSPIWYTDIGYVPLHHGLLASKHDFLEQRQAFHDAEVPVIYLGERILMHSMKNRNGRKLCQRTILEYLHSYSRLPVVPNESKIILLEYLSDELPFAEIADLAIFPFEDGVLRAINKHRVFLHRNASEKELFGGTPEYNLDIDKVSVTLLKRLRQFAAKSPPSPLRLRQPGDLQEYCDKTVFRWKKFDESPDVIDANQDIRSFVYGAWKWITSFGLTKSTPAAISSLWLLPLINGKYRKIQPKSASLSATYTTNKNTKDIMQKIASLEPDSAPLMLDLDAFPDQTMSWLNQITNKFNMAIRNADMFTHFLEWLVEGRHLLAKADPADKARVLDAVVDWFWGGKVHDKLAKPLIRQLSVFKRVRRSDIDGVVSIDRFWTDITGDRVIGLKDIGTIPPSTDVTYFDVTDDRECGMIEKLKLADCLNTVQMIETIVIPSLQRGDYTNCPRDLLELLMCNFYHCSAKSQASIATLPIIPLDMRGLQKPQAYAAATSLINPVATSLKEIFFDDEFYHPETRLYEDFAEPLKKCGLKMKLDRMIILDRLKTYTSNRYPLEQSRIRVKALLQLPLSEDLATEEDFLLTIGSQCWLPALNNDRAYQLTEPTNCRDQEDFHLVGLVMPTLPFRVGLVWRLCFHWQDPIVAERLVMQLAYGIKKSDLQIVNSVLSYVAKSPHRLEYLQLMKGMKIVWSSAECFVEADIAYQNGARNLAPHLHTVEPGFWFTHSGLLANLGVLSSPPSKKLLELQQQLADVEPLGHTALEVALVVTRLLSLDATSSYPGLKVPDNKGGLVSVTDVAFNDLGPGNLPDKIFLTHPNISRETAELLQIEPLSERLLKGDLEILDIDEEEFNQHEAVTDGIRDTLERYPKEATFLEYLANADDCGSASEVNWLLDESSHPHRSLITPELTHCQGPSLLVHNDGVFSEKDFEGLKHVGRGSKRDDATSIGKFGRGSQTMYHWTNVPMILSGEFLLILDPQQVRLPLNYRLKRRKAGVKIKLSKLRRDFQDQLAPFNGLWGYALDLDYYTGTIFRFPLRTEGSHLDLLETSVHPLLTVTATFQDAFEIARLSLLFLKNIRKIDLHIRGKALEWEVRREIGSPVTSGWLLVHIEKNLSDHGNLSWTDRWWRMTEDLQDAPDNLQYRHKRTMKQIRCGIAAFVASESSQAERSCPKEPDRRFFNCLPLPFQSSLPVHINATFLLSGDRQSIFIDETARDAGSDWNKWILEEAIPQLYLSFLEDVGREIGEKMFSFFPATGSTGDTLSDLVRSSFWSLLPASHKCLYPVVENASAHNPDPQEKGYRQRHRSHRLVHLQEATFDVLATRQSSDLTTVLPIWFNNLVRPPRSLRDGIKRLPGVCVVNRSLVRKALQSKETVNHLIYSITQESHLLKSLLDFVTPVMDDDFDELNNCRILPIADGTLGTLMSRSQSCQRKYFSVDVTDKKLFSFAASVLVSDEIDTKFVEIAKQSMRFNIYSLDERHMGSLLELKRDWPAIPDHESSEWLLKFWKYMDERCPTTKAAESSDITTTYLNFQLQQFPLHEVRCVTKCQYASYKDLVDLPAVVEPSSADERTLCLSLPGLYLVDHQTMPVQLFTAERFLSTPASLYRLLKAMSLLASRQQMVLDEYVRNCLNRQNLECMQEIIITAFGRDRYSSDMFSDDSRAMLNEVLPLAQHLPIWASKSYDYVTALKALTAVNDHLVLPWSPNYDRFIYPRNNPSVLETLGVPLLDDETMLKEHVLKNLPSKIDSVNQAAYLQLITAMSTSDLMRSKDSISLLRKQRCAATRDGVMVKPSELYDHSDELFISAFRLEAMERFLFKDVECFHSFWRRVGLRCTTNGNIHGSDYVTCLRAISNRLEGPEDAYVDLDVATVLRPLCENDYALRNLSNDDWSLLATIIVFPLLSGFEDQPHFRRRPMESLAGSSKPLSLGQITSMEHLKVCWSQVPFASSEPSNWVLDRVSRMNYPTCAVVWKHLEYLASITTTIEESEVRLFLLDLFDSYEYLQAK
ncbi:hypothetical protein MMC11_008110 [Xylographa trunciseda]|nr:hypothetical protein [Xylographa trunciseda]